MISQQRVYNEILTGVNSVMGKYGHGLDICQRCFKDHEFSWANEEKTFSV